MPVDIKTTAVRVGDDLIINGSKRLIKNGSHADFICLLANTNKGPPHKSKSLIIVPMDLPGEGLILSYISVGKLLLIINR